MRSGRTIGLTLSTLLAACAASPPAPVEVVSVPPPTTAPLARTAEAPASSAAPEAPPPPLPFRQVNAGYAVEPRDPAPARPDMPGEAALVWEVIPAPPNRSGPTERDTTITRLVVRRGDRAEVVAQRDEAVFSSASALWHLVGRDLSVMLDDCAKGGGRVRGVRKHLVFESLERRPRRVAPMESHVRGGEWARLDLEAMVGPWVVATVDHFSGSCVGRPLGSAYRVVVDLDRAAPRTFAIPSGALERHQADVRGVLARGCGSGEDEVKSEGASFHYDRGGNLVVDYDFFSYTSTACFHGIAHVFVGTYELPPDVAPHGRLPAWLRAFLEEHPSRSASVIPAGREDAARAEFERLPKIAARLPRDSRGD